MERADDRLFGKLEGIVVDAHAARDGTGFDGAHAAQFPQPGFDRGAALTEPARRIAHPEAAANRVRGTGTGALTT